MAGAAVSLMVIVLTHVYLLSLNVKTNQLVTFWAPLEGAGLIVLYVALSKQDKLAFALVLAYAATMHMVLPLSQNPNYISTEDAIYGYQIVTQTLNTARWNFGSGTGSAQIYSYFPMIFLLTSVWSSISSIPPSYLITFGFAFINLTIFLTLRLLCVDLLKLTERQSNLVLFFYAMTPTIHRVESLFHYESYAVIFFPLFLLYALKPRTSRSETILAIIAILSISSSHYFTSYILMLTSIVLAASYFLLRGTRVQLGLLFLSILAPLAWTGTAAVAVFGKRLLTVQNVFSHLRNLSTLLNRLSATAATPVATYYPAPWFAELAAARNITLLLLGLLATVALCIGRKGKWSLRLARKDMFTYLAAAWVFAIVFAVAAYYGVVWSETVLASQGPGSASNRIAEFSFMQLALFGGLGFGVLVRKLGGKNHSWRMPPTRIVLAVLVVMIFVSSAVVQAYARTAYDSNYKPIYYDEYRSSFQEPVYVGRWWLSAANQSLTLYRPITGSRALEPFLKGYGFQYWWDDNLTSRAVNLNNETSDPFTAYYALDLRQLQQSDRFYNMTLSPQLVSSQYSKVDTIFSTGRIVILYKAPRHILAV